MKKLRALPAILFLCALLTACQVSGGRKDEDFSVVTSFYPLYVTALNVVGDAENVRLTNMSAPEAGCLHDYQLTTADRKKLSDADLFLVNGAGMESFLDKVIQSEKDLPIREACQGVELMTDENGEPNAHVWVSVEGAIQQTENIKNALCEFDPTQADIYAANADAYVKKLRALSDEMRAKLAGARGREILPFHEAFPYFAQEFGLSVVAVVEREPGEAPSPAELIDLVEVVRAHPDAVLFAEPQYDRSSADVIARETGHAVFTLDPVVGGDLDDRDAYINRMRENMRTLEEAFRLK